jgi:CTP synthase (UTP-ammonia lyase)
MMKYILVTGGGVSGIGKTVAASSIGVILKACNLRVTFIKIGMFFSTPFLLNFPVMQFC